MTAKTAAADAKEKYEPSDIFFWANQMVQLKEEVDVELLFLNKNGILYKTSRNKDLEQQITQLMIEPIIEFVLDGADTGIIVRSVDEMDPDKHILSYARVKDVDGAKNFMAWLVPKNWEEIEHFVEEEHDIKRIKAVVAKCSHPEIKLPFYIFKLLTGGNIIKGSTGWAMSKGFLRKMDIEAAIRIPKENHALILGDDLYLLNQSKVEQLFNYNARKKKIAQRTLARINANFKLNLPEGVTLDKISEDNKALVNKLQKVNPDSASQDAIVESADELGIELMVADDGAIVIMDSKDLARFVNLLNEDYMESPMSNTVYEIRGTKKLVKPHDENMSLL